jgi:hypothetical protein
VIDGDAHDVYKSKLEIVALDKSFARAQIWTSNNRFGGIDISHRDKPTMSPPSESAPLAVVLANAAAMPPEIGGKFVETGIILRDKHFQFRPRSNSLAYLARSLG